MKNACYRKNPETVSILPSSFVPNKLLDTLIERMNLKNDAELCRVLEVQPPGRAQPAGFGPGRPGRVRGEEVREPAEEHVSASR